MVSPASDTIFAVVELDAGASSAPDENTVILSFKATGGTYSDQYSQLSSSPGSYPTNLTTVAFVGVLEEYRYYIREQHAVSGDDSSELMPRLSRARVYPGTDAPYAGDALNLQSDIADGVTDLQVALGVDTDGDGSILDSASGDDEWLFNHVDDDPDEAGKWNAAANRPLYFVRINTLARTDRRELSYVSPAIPAIEDREYEETDPPTSDTDRRNRMYRRTLLQTMVDLRNLS